VTSVNGWGGCRGEHENGCSIWRMENVAGSFYAHSSIDPPARSLAIDICEMLQRTTSSTIDTERRDLRPDVASHNASLRKMPSSSRLDSTPAVKASSGRFLLTTSQFERMWWDKEAEARRTASIWRPVVPAGYAIIGDCLVEGYVSLHILLCHWLLLQCLSESSIVEVTKISTPGFQVV
jgi:vacuolar protein sorting-associated protein 13A/C